MSKRLLKEKKPDSIKGKVLAVVRRLFGEYGDLGITAQMIEKEE
jgi:hypothetical protein